MPYSITCSTKILTLAIAQFLFILVGVLCVFSVVPGVYILLSHLEEKIHYSLKWSRCTHSAAHSLNIFKLLSDIIRLYTKNKFSGGGIYNETK